jgi:hypothetical protein
MGLEVKDLLKHASMHPICCSGLRCWCQLMSDTNYLVDNQVAEALLAPEATSGGILDATCDCGMIKETCQQSPRSCA